MLIKRAKEFQLMPWKNGGGSTLELFKIPHPQKPKDFAFRISIAQVEQDGPFSEFPGIDRDIMLLEGSGFTLSMPGLEKKLSQVFHPYSFKGENKLYCRLINGPCMDFNVMTARSLYRSDLALISHAIGLRKFSSPTLSFVCLLKGTVMFKGEIEKAPCLWEIPVGKELEIDLGEKSSLAYIQVHPLT